MKGCFKALEPNCINIFWKNQSTLGDISQSSNLCGEFLLQSLLLVLGVSLLIGEPLLLVREFLMEAVIVTEIAVSSFLLLGVPLLNAVSFLVLFQEPVPFSLLLLLLLDKSDESNSQVSIFPRE